MSMNIPQTDPKAHYRHYKKEVDKAIANVLKAGRYILGDETKLFEKEFAAYNGVKGCAGVANGTDAITIALMACGLRPGDGVVTVSHTAVATVAAIERLGATPCFVDIDPWSYVMDPAILKDSLEGHFKKNRKGRLNIKAILPVHLYGHPCDMTEIVRLARRYDLYIVEDCAQAHGALFSGKNAGTLGDMGAFSFYPTKNLGCIGDGGAVITDDAKLLERARMIREYGWRKRYISEFSGMNSRLDEMQSAILRVYMRHMGSDIKRRRAIAAIYDSLLKDVVITPHLYNECEHAYHQYVVQVTGRDRIRDSLRKRGIGTLIHYPIPVHLQPAYEKRYPVLSPNLKNTEEVCKKIVSLPIYPELTDRAVRRVAAALISIAGDKRGE